MCKRLIYVVWSNSQDKLPSVVTVHLSHWDASCRMQRCMFTASIRVWQSVLSVFKLGIFYGIRRYVASIHETARKSQSSFCKTWNQHVVRIHDANFELMYRLKAVPFCDIEGSQKRRRTTERTELRPIFSTTSETMVSTKNGRCCHRRESHALLSYWTSCLTTKWFTVHQNFQLESPSLVFFWGSQML